jgi:hypothetical protein
VKITPLSAIALAVSLVAAATSWVGCSSGGDDVAAGDEQNVTSRAPGAGDPSLPPACQVVAIKDGHTMTPAELQKLDDPVANFLLKGQGCPLTLDEIQAKLVKVDPCTPDDDNLSSRFVSDRAQLLGRPDSYRAVIARQCQQRNAAALLMSVFGIATQVDQAGKVTNTNVPQNSVELIGEHRVVEGDKTTGVFNYYAREQNKWKFFGSSEEFVSQGYDCNADGACIPKAATKQRCAACHVGGGLVMKELASPWVNWEGSTETPGTEDLVRRHPQVFGRKGDGVDLEFTVASANNDEWIPSRIKIAKALGLKEVLRPLFCTLDMNLSSTGSRDDQFVNSNLLVDPIFNAFSFISVTIPKVEYESALVEIGHRIVDGRSSRQLVGADGKGALDTFFGFTFPMKSRQDNDYVRALVRQQIIDIDLVKDVLSIDMSRPVYSPTRCALLEATPDLRPDEMTFQKVKAAFVTSLGGVNTPPAKELLASLKNETDAGSHDFAARKYMEACSARMTDDRPAMIKDILAYASHLRAAAKRAKNPTSGGIIEFAETLPVDNLQETKAAFDPVTCKLK